MIGIAQKFVIPLQQLIKSTIIKDFLIFSSGSFLRRGISIFIAPITLSMVTPAEYGLLALANTAISIITVLIGLGLRQSFQLDYFHCTNTQRKMMINDIITTYLIIAIPFLSLLTFLLYQLTSETMPRSFIGVSGAICFIYFFVEFFYQLLKYQCKALFVAGLQLIIAIITIIFTLFFLWYLHWGIASILGAQLVGMFIVSLIAVRIYLQKTCHQFLYLKNSVEKIPHYLTHGLPFLPTTLFALLLASSDRWILARYTTMHEVGIYALANTFVQLFQLLILQPMTISYIPHTLNNFALKKDQLLLLEKNNRFLMYVAMIILAFVITVGCVLSKSLLYHLLPSAYHEAISYIWLLLMSHIFLFGTYFSTILIQFLQKRRFMSFVFIGPALLNIALNLLLVPSYGIFGCVIATFLSYLSYFLLTVWYSYILANRA